MKKPLTDVKNLKLTRRSIAAKVVVVLLLASILTGVSKIKPTRAQPVTSRLCNLVITSSDLEVAASRLAQWKNSSGMPSRVLNVEWINSTYSGVDEPEKIRNCIKDYYDNSQIEYVTIFGDADKVPTRYAYIPDENDDTNFTATDLYYADLNGTWDDNHDGLFADQRYDFVDGIPDVCIGRIPVSFVENSQPIVDKIIRYQQQFDPSQNWTRRVVLAAGTGNNGIENTHGTGFTVLNEFIANVTNDKEIVKLYEEAGNLSTNSMSREIDRGALFVNFAGHGDPGSTPIFSAGWLFYWIIAGLIWNGFGIPDVRSTTNDAELPVVTTCSCSTARFDDADCIGEWFVGHPTGGAIAYFGSTRVAYASANDSSPYGFMGEMDRRIYENFYGGFTRLGQMWREAIREYVQLHVANYQYASKYDAKTIMEFVLFGDPTLRIYNGPETLKVPDDYATIQGAINSAYDGDTIFVRNGTYYENVVVNKTVSLIGEDKSTTIIDGMGTGTVLNVTADDVSVTGFTIQKSGSEWVYTMDSGILIQSSNNRIENNVMSYNSAGIFLDSSDNNLLISNNVSNNRYGILLENSRNNTIKSNIILSNKNHGIGFSHSKNNTLASNDIVSNYFGIYLWGSENNTLAYNTLSNNEYGIRLSALSSSNALFGNNLYSNGDGILIVESENNVLRDNNLTNNRFEVIGYESSHYFQDVDTSNLVDGKHIYYLVTRSNLTVNPDTFQNIGYLAFVNCTNMIIERFNAISSNLPNLLLVQTTNSIIKNINITAGIQIIFSSNITLKDIDVHSTSYGLSFKFSDGNKISSSNIYSNNFGIYLDGSYNNILVNNTISNNGVGIRLGGNPSVNNLIFHNNFVNNSRQVDYEVLEISPMYWVNIWDNGYPSGGNYWSDYTGVDVKSGPGQDQPGSDGIGDTPYIIDGNNRDHYPFTAHNIAVTSVTPSQTVVGQGYSLNTTVTVANKGAYTESFNVTIYANRIMIGEICNIDLTSGNITTVPFTWNTTGFAKGNYTISAYAVPVPGETDTADNSFTGGWVIVSIVGDITSINGYPDGRVGLVDVYKVAMNFGTTLPNWDPYWGPVCDINNDGTVNLKDYYTVCLNFGNTDP
jgi:parallel beta-helix repeat protein